MNPMPPNPNAPKPQSDGGQIAPYTAQEIRDTFQAFGDKMLIEPMEFDRPKDSRIITPERTLGGDEITSMRAGTSVVISIGHKINPEIVRKGDLVMYFQGAAFKSKDGVTFIIIAEPNLMVVRPREPRPAPSYMPPK